MTRSKNIQIFVNVKKISKSRLNILSKRELEVVFLILNGRRTIEISKALKLKSNTISTVKKNIFYKLEIKSDVELYLISQYENILKFKFVN